MFRIEKTEYINKTFRFKKQLIDELAQYAAERDISLNQLVAECCRFALDNREV